MSLTRYRMTRVLMVTMLVIYPILAHIGPKNGRAEFYPFFNWSLFTNASDVRHDIVLIIHAIDGAQLPEPTLFFDLPEVFTAAANRDSRLAKFLDDYAAAHVHQDAPRITQLQAVLAERYLGDVQSVTYDLAVIRYQPVERYRTGEIMNVQVLRTVEIDR